MSHGAIIDMQSYQLLWEYLSLLIRQNGYFDLKTDISSLLLGENHNWHQTSASPNHQNTNDQTNDNQQDEIDDDDLTDVFSSKLKINGNRHPNQTHDTMVLTKLKEYLSNGNKLNAIDWLSKNNEWSHAFFIASTMQSTSTSSSSSSTIMSKLKLKFINSISQQDPIHTLYQLYIGRIPTLTTIDWNEWRLHLALILSNYDSTDTNNDSLVKNSIKKFADTLASNSRYAAAHFCYLLINTPFGDYKKKSSKIVLIGSSHKYGFLFLS
jgi:hypothetical protein